MILQDIKEFICELISELFNNREQPAGCGCNK